MSSADIAPMVRLMLLCDDVGQDQGNPFKLNMYGITSTIYSSANPPFPLRHRQLCVYLQLTEGRGTGEGEIVAIHADSEQIVFASPPQTLTFGTDPLAVLGFVFRLRDCSFPVPGLYLIQFRYNRAIIAQQPLILRERKP